MKEGQAENRRASRRPLAIQVRVTEPDGRSRTLLSFDAGPRGVFLRTLEPRERGTCLKLALALPRHRAIQVDGEVAWRTHGAAASGDRAGMGIRFTRVCNEDASLLRDFFGAVRGVHTRRVLVVDDDPALRSRLAAACRREGVDPAEADWEGAADAMAAPHALVILGADRRGLRAGVAQSLRADAPIVVLSGAGEVSQEWVREAVLCFQKPVDPARVVQMSVALLK